MEKYQGAKVDMKKQDQFRVKPAKILLVTGLIGAILAIIFWLYFLSKEQSTLKQFPSLGIIHNLQCKMAHIDEEMDSLISFRQAIHYPPEKFIQRCAYLVETYRNYEKQYKNLVSQPKAKESTRKKKRIEFYTKIACLSFFGFLLLIRIGADRLSPPLRHEEYISQSPINNKVNNSDIMLNPCPTLPIQLWNRRKRKEKSNESLNIKNDIPTVWRRFS